MVVSAAVVRTLADAATVGDKTDLQSLDDLKGFPH